MFKFVASLAAGLALTAALASAPHAASAASLPYDSAGIVNANGSIEVGSGFTVQHTGTGTYVITYPTTTGFYSVPVVTVSPFGVNGHYVTGVVTGLAASSGGATITVQMTDKLNRSKLEDNAFLFLLIES